MPDNHPMGKEAFDFFQEHSRNYLEMALRTDRHQRLENPDGFGDRTGDCGDSVEFYLSTDHDRIRAVSFIVHGCINTNACSNTVAQLAEGRTVAQAWGIEVEDIVEYLETLPSDHIHCAELAVGAFYLALSNFKQLQRHPWKKAYGR